MHLSPKYVILFFLLLTLCISCTKDIDFDQAREYQFNPVVESSLVFFNESANAFIDQGAEVEIVQDFIFIDFFNDDFIVDNVEKISFNFETQNSINRRFELQVDLYDEALGLQDSFVVIQEASSDGQNEIASHVEVFEDERLVALKNTHIILFTLRLLPGPNIDETTSGRIELKSKAVFYFEIKDVAL